jgi:hypothetical protein
MNEFDLMRSVCTGIRREKDSVVRYEVHREREDSWQGKQTVPRPPIIEKFYGLDRARLAALGHALDGPSQKGGITGVVRVYQKLYSAGGDRLGRQDLIDVIDERVAFRLLNELRLPRADELAVSRAELQSELDSLLPR